MMRCAFIVTVCLLLAEAWAANDVGKDHMNDLKEISNICDEYYCPAYTVKEKAVDYELREYESEFTAMTEITDIDPELAKNVLFLRLKGYTMGDNVAHEKVQHGLPGFMIYYIKEDGTLIKNFTKSLFISPQPSKEIPAPLNPLVKLVTWPPTSYYAATYTGGFLTLDEVIGHTYTLAQALKRDNRAFVEGEFSIGCYENIEKHLIRHIEIFFFAK